MTFTVIEWFALIVAVFGLVKILTLLIKPDYWFDFSHKIWKRPNLVSTIALIFAAVVFYYLIKELTITQIFAAMLFFSLLFVVGMAPLAKEFLSLDKKRIKTKFRNSWPYLLIWLALIIWVLKELFFLSFSFLV